MFPITLSIAILLHAIPDIHPVHLTVTELYTEKKSGNVDLSTTLFMDDFAKAIHYSNYEKQIQEGKVKPEALMERYLQAKLRLRINNKEVSFTVRRTENNMDAVTCYLTLKPNIKEVHQLYIENKLLIELFDDQRNMVQVQLEDKPAGVVQFDKKKTTTTLNL